MIRATTQKNFESDVLNGKRPSARHALCKAPARSAGAPGAPAPGGERAPAAAGGGRSGWARVSFQGVENATALDSGEGCAPLQTYSRKRRIAHSGTANFKVCELYLDKAHVKETGRGQRDERGGGGRWAGRALRRDFRVGVVPPLYRAPGSGASHCRGAGAVLGPRSLPLEAGSGRATCFGERSGSDMCRFLRKLRKLAWDWPVPFTAAVTGSVC